MSFFPVEVNIYYFANRVMEGAYFSIFERPKPEDAIIIAGSGRSGTTWIHNILGSIPGSQLIFEPLNPNFVGELRGLTSKSRTAQPRVHSQYLSFKKNYPEWHTYLSRVLTGRVRNTWIDRNVNPHPPYRYIIKTIRANLMLAYIKHNFNPKMIYIIRHPCAVILSRLNNGWSANIEDLLSQEALIEDYLRPWISLIERERGLLSAHAIWWGVENMIAMRDLKESDHFFIVFEDICLCPGEVFDDLFSWLGFPKMKLSERLLRKPSRMSDIAHSTTRERIGSWKKRFTAQDQEEILSWVERFGIDLYSDDILPQSMNRNGFLGV